jgi:hypothetical protein
MIRPLPAAYSNSSLLTRPCRRDAPVTLTMTMPSAVTKGAAEHTEGNTMKHLFKLAIGLTLLSGHVYAQNNATPKPEDAEKNAFQTPTTGKKGATGSSGKANSQQANPESRLNDDPPSHEKVGAPNNSGK